MCLRVANCELDLTTPQNNKFFTTSRNTFKKSISINISVMQRIKTPGAQNKIHFSIEKCCSQRFKKKKSVLLPVK